MGFESRLFGSRVNSDFTYYNKAQTAGRAFVNKPIAPSSGASATERLDQFGVGSEHWYRGGPHDHAVDNRRISWDMTLSGSHGSNHIRKVYGPNGYCSATITTAALRRHGPQRNIKGNPVNGL
jgi:hypothetical protein